MKKTKETLPEAIPLTAQEEAYIDEQFHGLLDDYAHTRKGDKADLITRVFQFTKKAQGNKRRLSGEPQICHSLAVARIVSHDIGMGSTPICAALMHAITGLAAALPPHRVIPYPNIQKMRGVE